MSSRSRRTSRSAGSSSSLPAPASPSCTIRPPSRGSRVASSSAAPPTAATREAKPVVVRAQVRVARLATTTAIARDEPLANDAVSALEVVDVRADLGYDPAPLVARNARIAHPATIQCALEDLEIGT